MNPEIREAIIRAFDGRILWMDYQLPEAVKQQTGINVNEVMRTIHLMKDTGELVPEGIHGAIRLSLKAVQSQAPKQVRFGRYMYENWIAIAALVISLLGVIVALIALFRS